MTEREEYMYDFLVENEFFTDEELGLLKNVVGGTWEEVLNMAIYARYGYNSLEQMVEE